MNDDNNKKEHPVLILTLAIICIATLIIFVVKDIATVVFLALSEGGWKWLLVIVGLVVFSLLIMSNERK